MNRWHSETVAQLLQELDARPGGLSPHQAEERLRREGAVAAVTLRACQAGPAGFQSYLGERYNQETEQWEEIYGRRVHLTFGLDLYALPQAGEAALQTVLDTLAQACAGAGPEGLAIQEFSSGETTYDGDSRLLEAYQRPLFMGYHRGQPFNGNHLRPCPLLDNPGALSRVVDESGARSTDLEHPEDVHDLSAKCTEKAEKWAVTAGKLWDESHPGCGGCGGCRPGEQT